MRELQEKFNIHYTLLEAHLENYIPKQTIPLVLEELRPHFIQLCFKAPRGRIYGTYQPKFSERKLIFHQITVNNNLKEDLFLSVFLHELAHFHTFLTYKNKVAPHGVEWKINFQSLLKKFFEQDVFREEKIKLWIKDQILDVSKIRHSCNFDFLTQDQAKKEIVIPENASQLAYVKESEKFYFQNQLYIKMKNLRVNALCLQVKSNKKYLIRQVAIVKLEFENN